MCRVNADVFPGSLNSNNDIVVAMIVADAVKLTQSGLGDSQSVNRTTLFSLSQTNYHSNNTQDGRHCGCRLVSAPVLRLSKNNLARDQLLLMNAPALLPSITVMLELASLNILRNPRKCTEREVSVIHTVVSTIDNEFQSKKKRKYNRSRRRKPTLQCHGCKNTTKRKTGS